MPYIEMEPELIWRAIEGYENELAAESRSLEAFYRQFKCPRCGGSCQKEFNVNHAFADKEVMNPRALLRCIACSCLIDPYSGIVLEIGKPLVPHVGIDDDWKHLR